jgi:hypothetical protein
MRNKIIILVLITLLPAIACKRNRYNVDVSSINVGLNLERFEKDLFEADPADIEKNIPVWSEKYGDFLPLFGYVINAGEMDSPDFSAMLLGFCTDRQNNMVYADVESVFPSLDGLQSDLEEAFRHYLYYFPEKIVPKIYSCVTGFNTSLIIGDSVVGISLDRYLGRDTEYYPQLGLYNYIILRMAPEYIVSDVMYGWNSTEWDFDNMGYSSENVLTQMIHEGKLRFLQRCMLPEVNDTVIFGFTSDQIKFCVNNESQMWTYLMENDLLFSSDQFVAQKLIGEGPFTSYFTNESPGRAATWVGFRIVESYMKNSDTSLEELMADTDIQGILNGAKYAP